MPRVALLLLSLLIATASLAQTRIDAGVALGAQPYEESEDSTRVLTGAEVLFQHNSIGLHVAVEYTDLSFGDAMYAKHFDAIYRHAFAGRYSVLVGAGITAIDIQDFDTSSSWNAELELSRRFGNTDVFARVRHYDYEASGFRARVSPSGPAIYLGVRFGLKR